MILLYYICDRHPSRVQDSLHGASETSPDWRGEGGAYNGLTGLGGTLGEVAAMRSRSNDVTLLMIFSSLLHPPHTQALMLPPSCPTPTGRSSSAEAHLLSRCSGCESG